MIVAWILELQLPRLKVCTSCLPAENTVVGLTQVLEFYELYVENCHCRHIFLALGHDSEYYKTLQMYNDDQYTKSKTSLIRPDQGFSGAGVDLSYHTVKFSTLCSIPRAPVDSPQTSQPSLNGGAKDNNSHVDLQPPIIANRYSSVTSTVKPLVNPGTVPLSLTILTSSMTWQQVTEILKLGKWSRSPQRSTPRQALTMWRSRRGRLRLASTVIRLGQSWETGAKK